MKILGYGFIYLQKYKNHKNLSLIVFLYITIKVLRKVNETKNVFIFFTNVKSISAKMALCLFKIISKRGREEKKTWQLHWIWLLPELIWLCSKSHLIVSNFTFQIWLEKASNNKNQTDQLDLMSTSNFIIIVNTINEYKFFFLRIFLEILSKIFICSFIIILPQAKQECY